MSVPQALTDHQIGFMKAELVTGTTIKSCATAFGVSVSLVEKISCGASYGHIEPALKEEAP